MVRSLGEGGASLELLTRPNEAFAAPAHLDAEVGHALRGLVRGRIIDEAQGAECIVALQNLIVMRVPLELL